MGLKHKGEELIMASRKDNVAEVDAEKAGQDSAPDEALDVGATDEEGDVLDFSNVSKYDAVPTNMPYVCTLDKLAKGKSAAGNPTYSAEFVVSEPEEHAGQAITRVYTVTEKAMFGIFGLIVGMGENPEELKTSKDFKLEPMKYLGMSAVVFASNNLYQGRTTSQVQRVAPIGEWDELKKIWDETPEEARLPF